MYFCANWTICAPETLLARLPYVLSVERVPEWVLLVFVAEGLAASAPAVGTTPSPALSAKLKATSGLLIRDLQCNFLVALRPGDSHTRWHGMGLSTQNARSSYQDFAILSNLRVWPSCQICSLVAKITRW